MTSSSRAPTGLEELLAGWRVGRAAEAAAPVAGAARLLAGLGASEEEAAGPEALRLTPPEGAAREVRLAGWGGEGCLAAALAGSPVEAPTGAPLTAFAACALAAAGLAEAGPPRTLGATALVEELLAAQRAGGPARSELLRCDDGWLVARWRDEGERALCQALLGDPTALAVEEAEARAREARLLVGAVRPPRPPRRFAVATDCRLDGAAARRRPHRVVDWSVLWGGPWASRQLMCGGGWAVRVEHPRRRDGLLAWPRGRAWWHQLNRGKLLALIDAREAPGAHRLRATIADADLLVTSMTPRALASLGFDDDWRRRHAPHLLHLELVAFEDPWGDSPGLGEQAAARAGLLWTGERCRPRTPYPWADPLLGAAALLVGRAWLAAGTAPGGRVRLSLESAASLALAAADEFALSIG